MKPLWWRCWWLIRYAHWAAGWNTRRTWKDKAYLHCGFTYYDGLLWSLHLGPLWFAADENQ